MGKFKNIIVVKISKNALTFAIETADSALGDVITKSFSTTRSGSLFKIFSLGLSPSPNSGTVSPLSRHFSKIFSCCPFSSDGKAPFMALQFRRTVMIPPDRILNGRSEEKEANPSERCYEEGQGLKIDQPGTIHTAL